MMLLSYCGCFIERSKAFFPILRVSDNVPTDGGKEDHVSMGMTAAVKMRSIVDIAEMATAIELLTAAQALEFRLPLNPGQGVKKALQHCSKRRTAN